MFLKRILHITNKQLKVVVKEQNILIKVLDGTIVIYKQKSLF